MFPVVPFRSDPPAPAFRRAFSLVELIIVILIISILAAIVVPRYSEAESMVYGTSLRQDLRYIRMQIQTYDAQHQGLAPGVAGGTASETTFVSQMTMFTNIDGATSSVQSDAYRFGPYLDEVPANPVNGQRAIFLVADGDAFPPPPTAPLPYGWAYKPETLEFRAYVMGEDENGTAYYDY